METDKEFYAIFAALPQWLFDLTGLESPGDCEVKSITLKSLELRSDAVFFPKDEAQPLTVVEFQFRHDPTIYARVANEMALLQQEHQMRAVQGVILFRDAKLDRRTKPWCDVVRSFYFDEVVQKLAKRQPDHPLIAVFQPLLQTSEDTLEMNAKLYYNQINNSELIDTAKSTLLDVFLQWLEKRFKQKSKEEIEKMFIGELPDLRETQSGKDLIRIGKEEGKIEGEREALLWAMESKFGKIDSKTRQRIVRITSVEKLKDLLLQVFKTDSLDQLNW